LVLVRHHDRVRKTVARERFSQFVAARAKLGHQEQFYETENGVLGSEEFVDEMIHRIGEFDTRAAAARRKVEGHAPQAQA